MERTVKAALLWYLSAESPSLDEATAVFEALAAGDETKLRALVCDRGPVSDDRWDAVLDSVR